VEVVHAQRRGARAAGRQAGRGARGRAGRCAARHARGAGLRRRALPRAGREARFPAAGARRALRRDLEAQRPRPRRPGRSGRARGARSAGAPWSSQELLELVRWMRTWNADEKHAAKLQITGLDMLHPAVAPGSCRTTTPRSIRPRACAFAAFLGPFRQVNDNGETRYDSLDDNARMSLKMMIMDMVGIWPDVKEDYVALSSPDEFEGRRRAPAHDRAMRGSAAPARRGLDDAHARAAHEHEPRVGARSLRREGQGRGAGAQLDRGRQRGGGVRLAGRVAALDVRPAVRGARPTARGAERPCSRTVRGARRGCGWPSCALQEPRPDARGRAREHAGARGRDRRARAGGGQPGARLAHGRGRAAQPRERLDGRAGPCTGAACRERSSNLLVWLRDATAAQPLARN
jgi:hypothetical protein